MNTNNQSIPNITATQLTLPTRNNIRQLLLVNNTVSPMWIGTVNTITDSTTTACVLPANSNMICTLGVSTNIFVYQISGAGLRIDWLLSV